MDSNDDVVLIAYRVIRIQFTDDHFNAILP